MTTTPPQRRRPGLEKLMAAADELLYAEGIGRTGIHRILETAGVAKGTLYGNFTSKDELVEAYLEKRHRDTMEAVTTELAHRGGSDVEAVLDALLSVGERRSSADSFRGCAFTLAVAEMPEDDSPARRWAAEHKGALKQMLVDAMPERADADEVAEELMVLYDGALLSAALRPGAESFRAARRAAALVLAEA